MRNGTDTRTGLFPFLLVDDDQAKVRIRVGFTKERSEEKSMGDEGNTLTATPYISFGLSKAL